MIAWNEFECGEGYLLISVALDFSQCQRLRLNNTDKDKYQFFTYNHSKSCRKLAELEK